MELAVTLVLIYLIIHESTGRRAGSLGAFPLLAVQLNFELHRIEPYESVCEDGGELIKDGLAVDEPA